MTRPIKVAINGFGRIGRKVARLALENENFEIVAINDLTPIDQMVHLLKYDSVHGSLPREILESTHLDGNTLHFGRHRIRLSAEKDPTQLGWNKVGAEYTHECTGVFTSKEKAGLHLKAGAKRVIISAPSPDADATLCVGVNHESFNPSQHQIVSNASCTTNCLAPLVKVIDENFGIKRGTMLTVHSYTNDQRILDVGHKDLRRARAAALSMIPTTTGAAKAVGLVLPHLAGKLDGLAVRVPTPNVSLVQFTGETTKSATKKEINDCFIAASKGNLKGILGVCAEPLVSIDFNGNTHSSTIDLDCTNSVEGNLINVISWYDNESGFSKRMIDLSLYMASKE